MHNNQHTDSQSQNINSSSYNRITNMIDTQMRVKQEQFMSRRAITMACSRDIQKFHHALFFFSPE